MGVKVTRDGTTAQETNWVLTSHANDQLGLKNETEGKQDG